MTDRRRRSVLAALVLVALVLVTLDYRGGDTGPLATLQRGVLTVFSPLMEGVATVVRPIGGVFSSIGDLGGLDEENAALQAELAQARAQLQSQTDLERQIAELGGQLSMREQLSLTTVGTRVLGRPVNGSAYSVLVDSGADEGLAAGMAVINEAGLVGRVAEVTGSTARVQLVTDPGTGGFVVRLAATGERGLLNGRGAQPFLLELQDAEAVVEPESEVVTQAFPGSTIPDGLPIGVIADAGMGSSLPVSPYVDFSRLSVLQVVTDYPPPPAELDRADVRPAPEGERPEPLPGEDGGEGSAEGDEGSAEGDEASAEGAVADVDAADGTG